MINLRAITEIGKADKQAEVNRQIALAREEKKRQRKADTQNNKVYCDEKEDGSRIHSVLSDISCFSEECDPVFSCHEVFKVYCTESDNKVQEKNGTIRGTKGEPNHNQTFKEEKTINGRSVHPHDEEKQSVFTSVDLTKAMRETGIEAQSADPRIMVLAAQGISPATIRAACEEARRAKPNERVGAAYVMKIVERWAKEAAAMDVRGVRPASVSRKSPVFAERKRVLDGLTGRTEEEAESISIFTDDNTIEGEIVLSMEAIKLTNADIAEG